MSKRKKPYEKKPFESTGKPSDTSANLYMSMLTSPAWKSLSAQQQALYLCCKAQYYGEKIKPEGNQEYFTMNKGKWCNLYGLYDENNGKGFRRDMGKLIEKGFIACVECGAVTRTKTIYRFSDKWQQYGNDCFQVLPSEMTLAMQRKAK